MTPRYSARAAIQAIGLFSSPECRGAGWIHDVSVPGCRLHTSARLRPGQSLQLELMLMPPHAPLHITLAIVRWVDVPWAGLEFIGMSSEDQLRLRRLVGGREWQPLTEWIGPVGTIRPGQA